jgi:plastocyanin
MGARITIAGVTVAAALIFPGAALADATIQAVDGALPDGSDNRWTPNVATVKTGEKVTWSFGGTSIPHNVKSASANWSLDSATSTDTTVSFSAPGVYEFYCKFHASPMRGTITVTDATGAPPPPPPPPPLSEQPFVNDFPAPTVLEVRDRVAPKLDRVKVTRVRKGAKVRLRLSEPGKVAIRITRGKKLIKKRTVELRKGTSTVTVRGLRKGHYRVRVTAADLAGNKASHAKRARVTVRS